MNSAALDSRLKALDAETATHLTPKLFDGISDHDHELIQSLAVHRRVNAKEVVIHGGDKAAYLFLVTAGHAKYYRVTREGEEILLWWLSPGDIFGLATLLKNPPGYMGSVETVEGCELRVWEHARMQELAAVYPQLTQNALRIAMGYLSAYAQRHAGIVTRNSEDRLADVLLQLGHRVGRVQPKGVEVDITNEQLGGLADVGLFTASRLISKWERQGAVAKARGKILIRTPEKLLTD
jgi:CRP/FNR family transcriptional regulator, nitrogen oxide reductase regulator